MPAEPTSAQLRRQARKEADSQPFEKVSGHAREIEQKRARGEASIISCAECRRLKIKCSKEIPCQSCIRRGCRSICPQGSLATGEGTRYVLAATEHLHRRIAKMNTRIRELEDALADVHRAHSDEPHPLLREDIISRPTVEEPPPDEMQTADIEKPPNDTIDAFGTLSISEQGVSRFFGSTAGSEVMMMLSLDPADEDSPANTPSPPSAHAETASSSTVAFFSRSFPFTPLGSSQEAQTLIESYLPTWDRAQHLCRLYFSDVFWLIKTVVPSQVYEDMLPVIYRRQDAIPGEEYDTPHNLSLLFIILALGSLVEATADLPDGLHNLQEAEHYHQISKAALPLQPILERPSIYAVQALHLMGIYNAMSGEDLSSQNNMELTWNLTTLAAHVAQTIGLHRDSARWGLSEKMVQRRRVIFWDLFVAENWNCLSTGRPPSFKLSYIDCKLPESGDAMPYESWALRFAQDCVAETASQACASQTPSYEAIMELDKKVRDYPLPNMSTSSMPESVVTYQRCICDHIRETILLFIHRSFFAQAIVDEPSNPLKSVYAPSFLAAYRASSQILRVVKDQFQTAPTMTSRWWMTWSFAFSAALVFGMVVTKGPSSPLANSAMKELDEACILFSKVAPMNRRASKALVILSRLNAKARAALASAKDGSDSGAGWGSVDDYDDLSIFAGHTRLVSNKQRIPELSAGSGYSAAPVPLSLPTHTPTFATHPAQHDVPRPETITTHFTPSQQFARRESSQSHHNPREISQVRAYSHSPWPVQPPQPPPMPSQSPHDDIPGSSIPTPISATARQGGVRRYGSSQDIHGYPGWEQSSINTGSAREELRREVVPPTPYDYGQQEYNYSVHPPPQHRGPPQMYGQGGANYRVPYGQEGMPPLDLTGMGIAGSRMDERFLSFVTDSGILGSEENARGRHQPHTQHHTYNGAQ